MSPPEFDAREATMSRGVYVRRELAVGGRAKATNRHLRHAGVQPEGAGTVIVSDPRVEAARLEP